jgi:hypothetical protein
MEVRSRSTVLIRFLRHGGVASVFGAGTDSAPYHAAKKTPRKRAREERQTMMQSGAY